MTGCRLPRRALASEVSEHTAQLALTAPRDRCDTHSWCTALPVGRRYPVGRSGSSQPLSFRRPRQHQLAFAAVIARPRSASTGGSRHVGTMSTANRLPGGVHLGDIDNQLNIVAGL